MYVSYNKMPKNSRLWIHQANRPFTKSEIEKIQQTIVLFLNHWQRHGEDLIASYTILHNQFIVLLVNEDILPVSGCAIDSSMELIKKIESDFLVDLTNKLLISYKENDKIQICEFTNFKTFIKTGKINENTIVFNNLITTKQELETLWEVPLKNSWHKKLIK